MPTENLTTETTVPEFGPVTGCVPDDCAELFDLYCAVYPSATFATFGFDITNQDFWAILRSKDGPIIAAMIVTGRGCVVPLVRPKDAAAPWAVDAVLRLAEEVRRAPRGPRAPFSVAIPRELGALATQLERMGFLGPELCTVSLLDFDVNGKAVRVN